MIMPNIPRERLVELKRFAGEIRKETVKEISVFGTGHIGGSLSIADGDGVVRRTAATRQPHRVC